MIFPMEHMPVFCSAIFVEKQREKVIFFSSLKKCILKNLNNGKGKNIQILPSFPFFPPKTFSFQLEKEKMIKIKKATSR